MPIKSNSQIYLESKSDLPQVSALMAKSVSQNRRESLAGEVEQGLFKDGTYNPNKQHALTANGNVTHSVGMKKTAQMSSSGGGTVKQAPDVYSPLWLNSNLNLPRDRATVNAWCRSFYALNPFVQNAINLHSTYPISKLNIRCANKEAESFFNDMIEELDLMNVCVQIAQEYWLLGEAFPYAELNQQGNKWSHILIQNPDYMVIGKSIMTSESYISMKPDENLKKIVSSNKPSDVEQRKQLNQHIIQSIKSGGNIPLDNFNVSHIARKMVPYDIRGTGLPVSTFRQLMLFDRLRESKFAQADNMVNPLTLVKIGSEGVDGLHPSAADLEAWRNVFMDAESDKDFKIFTHPGVTVERVGYGTGIYDISGDITQLIKEIFIGLQVPSVLMDGGADTTYANGGVALDVLRQRYMQFRNMLSSWLKRKIFAPISKINGFYDMVDGKKKLTIPEIDWNHMSLFDAGDYINSLMTMTQGEGEAKRASLHTLYRSMGLEWEDEQRKMRKEAIAGVIFKKEKVALESMDLNSLRALNPDDDEIKEADAAPGSSMPSSDPGAAGSLPPMDAGAPPPEMPPLPGAP